MSSPLVGAWEIESDTLEGLTFFTEKHYSIVFALKGRQRAESSEPTPEEAMEAYRSVNATTGTYTVSGSTLTHQRTANLRAQFIGKELVSEFSIEGDKMNVRVIRGAGSADGSEFIFRKVS
jgi:hypothetical protein